MYFVKNLIFGRQRHFSCPIFEASPLWKFVSLLLCVMLSSCNNDGYLDESKPTVTSVTVTSDIDSVAAGLSVVFTATAILSDDTTRIATTDGSEVKWTIVTQSDIGENATIDANTGVLTTMEGSTGDIVVVQAKGISATWSDTAEKTITVTNATVESVAVTSDTDRVAAGFFVYFTATATLSDGTTHVATTDGNEVNWAIISQEGENASIDAHTGVLTTTTDSVGDITVQAKGTSTVWGDTANKTITVTATTVESVAVTSDADSVAAGFLVAFTATATLSDGTTHVATTDGREVSWTISNAADVGKNTTIDTMTGVLTTTADSVGDPIVVQAKGISPAWNGAANKTITVTPATVESVAVTSDTDRVVAGFSVVFTAAATLSNNTTHVATTDGKEVNWTIVFQEGKNATIDTNTGVLTTAADSVGDIIVRAKGVSDAWYNLTDKTIAVTTATVESVTVTSDTNRVAAGLLVIFTATATSSDSTTHIGTKDGREINWTIISQKGDNATIDANTGVLTTTSDSVGDITVQAKGTSTAWHDTADKTITVTNAIVESVAVTSDTDSVAAGFSVAFTATATFSDGMTHIATMDGSDVNWTVIFQEGENASIDAHTGVLTTTADSEGDVTVQAKGTSAAWDDAVDKTITVTNATVESVVVTSNTDSIAAGFSVAFTATAILSDGTTHIATTDGSEVNWTLSDETDAGKNSTIDAMTGILTTTADSVGGVIVQAKGTSTAWDDTVDKTITVTNATVESVVVTSNTDSIAAGFSVAFTATAILSDGTTHIATTDGREISWTIISQKGENATIDANTGVLTTTSGSVGDITVQAKGTSAAWGDTADKTITVTPATVESVAVTSDTDSVAAGFSMVFIATATLSDGTTHIATTDGSEVNWTISNETDAGKNATIEAMTGVLTTTVDSVGVVIVQAKGTSVAWDNTADKVITVTDVEVKSVVVMPSSGTDAVMAGLPVVFTATATLSDDTTHIATTDGREVNWTISHQQYYDENITIGANSGVLTTTVDSKGEITVQATGTSDAWSGTADKTITIEPFFICGGVIDDDDKLNAKEACLKVVEYDGLWFTGAPSLAALNALGYVQASGNASNNGGRTYVSTEKEDGSYGPVDGTFGAFDQLLIGGSSSDSISVEGIGGQYDRWCQALNRIEFLNKSNWRMASHSELINLYYKDRNGLYPEYGWATHSAYWTSTVASTQSGKSGFRIIYLGGGSSTITSGIDKGLSASCVSE